MIVFVAGTRPEAIKVGPVYAAAQAHGADVLFVCTGQHRELLVGTPVETDLRQGIGLDLPSDGNVTRWVTTATRRIVETLREVAAQAPVAAVAVQGDTMSALAGALAAVEVGLPLAHIEAGIRSGNPNEPWPEENNRIEIDRLATWLYAPTSLAFSHLICEGRRESQIRVTGNSVVSALTRYTRAQSVAEPEPYVLVTLHRREILTPGKVAELLEGVKAAARCYPGVRFVWPMHPHFKKLAPIRAFDDVPNNVVLVGPMGYEAFALTLAKALGALTDSGGVVEEAATLGVPTVILRRCNDRREAVEAGIAVEMAPTNDNVVQGAKLLVNEALPRRPSVVFGGPEAADVIARHLVALPVPESAEAG